MKTCLELRPCVQEMARARNQADQALRIRCLEAAMERRREGSALDWVMEYLRQYDRDFTPYVNGELYLAGVVGFFRLPGTDSVYGMPGTDHGLVWDGGHFCANYQRLIQEGIDGIRRRLEAQRPDTPEAEQMRRTYLETAALFVSYMERHADRAEAMAAACQDSEIRENLLRMAGDIRYLCGHKPKTFLQGLQMILFAHAYILLKPYTDTVTFGNLDRTLESLYQADIDAGTLTRDKARELICHFFLALSCMDQATQNIVLGGSDAQGNYFENDLTVLFLEAQGILHLEQPSVSLKIRPETSDAVWEAALNLMALGGGMPSLLNDPLIRRALVRAGFSQEEANTFCNVGCYEAVPYGNTFGGTVTGNLILPRVFADFFAQAPDYPSFQAFLEGWEAYLENYYTEVRLPFFTRFWERIYRQSASPFLGLILDGCIESLRLPEQMGAKHHIFSVNIGGIGTLTDSLLCVKHFVYDQKVCTLSRLQAETGANFPDEALLADLRAYPRRFGSGDSDSQTLAVREAELLADLVYGHTVHAGVRMLPSLFQFVGDIYTEGLPATPDGRRVGDRYSYGAAASELLPKRDVTKVLLATAGLPLERFPIGAPMTVNLTADVFQTQKGRQVVRAMGETFMEQGGFHIQVETANPETLRDAQKHPEQYADLLIRISGHTEPFTRLCKLLQDALIARAQMGC